MDKGFEPPLFVTSVGANGGMMHSSIVLDRESDTLRTDLLTDYYPDGEIVGLRRPINVMTWIRGAG